MIFHKTKHILMVRSSSYAPWIYPNELKTWRPLTDLHIGVYSNCIIIVKAWRKPRYPSVDE